MERWRDGEMERWRDGGLSYPSLRDRKDVLTIRSFAQMTLSGDDKIRDVMRQFIEDENKFRRIESDSNAIFLDWKKGEDPRKGTPMIIARTRGACKSLRVKVKLEDRQMIIKTEESEMKTNLAIGIGRFLTQKVVRSRKIKSLLEKLKHGAMFATLKDNQISNKILSDAKTMKSDAFFRFIVAADQRVEMESGSDPQKDHLFLGMLDIKSTSNPMSDR
jgi:hypothetical protein